MRASNTSPLLSSTAPDRRTTLLRSRRVRLEPVGPHHYEFIAELSTRPEHLVSWRYQGRTPSPDEVIRDLWTGVLAQFVVTTPSSGRPAGLVVSYDADLQSGTARVAALADLATGGPGMVVEGVGVLLGYLFRTFRLRKVYIEATEPAFEQFGNRLTDFSVEEGRLTEHRYVDGRYVDLITLAITRERWDTSIRPLLDPDRTPDGT